MIIYRKRYLKPFLKASPPVVPRWGSDCVWRGVLDRRHQPCSNPPARPFGLADRTKTSQLSAMLKMTSRILGLEELRSSWKGETGGISPWEDAQANLTRPSDTKSTKHFPLQKIQSSNRQFSPKTHCLGLFWLIFRPFDQSFGPLCFLVQ